MWSRRHPALPGPLPWAKWKGQHRIVRQMPLAFPGRPDCLWLCSDGWSGTLGRTGLRLILRVGLISLLGVLLVVALIKCCMRLTEQIWSYSLLVKLIKVAGGGVYSRGNLPEAEASNKGWLLLGDSSPRAFDISACFGEQRHRPPLFPDHLFKNAVEQTALEESVPLRSREQAASLFLIQDSPSLRSGVSLLHCDPPWVPLSSGPVHVALCDLGLGEPR